MSNTSIGLKLEAASHANEGAKLVAKDNTWSSSAGGWLPNSGTWIQSADGVRLIASDGCQRHAAQLGTRCRVMGDDFSHIDSLSNQVVASRAY